MGPFGFLSLDTAEYSGNMALKDQLLAIKWTNENIHKFGGDKNRITLFGSSSGSACVHSHLFSNGSYGLFQRVILSSGTVVNPWTLQAEPYIPLMYKFGWLNFLFMINILKYRNYFVLNIK